MNISLNTLLEEANNQIQRLTYEETAEIINNQLHVIIDVREESEVQALGLIKNAINIPRGVIEFKLAPNSLHNPLTINDDTFILVYCAGGYRSALAAKVLEDIGFKNVFNIGGFGEWISNGGEIEAIN
jgi:rhodanese-related sulfurtransferase